MMRIHNIFGKNLEGIILILLGMTLLASIFYVTSNKYFDSHLDSAVLVQNIESTAKYGYPNSQMNTTGVRGVEIASTPSEILCANLESLKEGGEKMSMFKRHAYFFLYPMAIISSISSGVISASIFHALSFVGMLFFAYWVLRKEMISIGGAMIFVALLASHPAWSYSTFGQFYLDRNFILFGFVYIFLLRNYLTSLNAKSFFVAFVLGLIAASLTERAALMVGVSTIAYTFLYVGFGKNIRRAIFPYIFGFLVTIYALVYLLAFQTNEVYGSFFNTLFTLFSDLRFNEDLRLGLYKFIWINFGYLVLAFFEWRMALVAFAMMLPNIIGTIGGAEKIGWSTHYHSIYFPFLIAASLQGYCNILLWSKKSMLRICIYLLMLSMSLYLIVIDPFKLRDGFFAINVQQLQYHGLARTAGYIGNFGDGGVIKEVSAYKKRITDFVPLNSSVSAPEGLIPSLSQSDRAIHLYPLGVGSAEYVVTDFRGSTIDGLKIIGAATYLGKKNNESLDACVQTKIQDEYDLLRLYPYAPGANQGIAIFRRRQ